MVKDLIKLANKLDQLGLTKEADALDSFVRKTAMHAGSGRGREFKNKEHVLYEPRIESLLSSKLKQKEPSTFSPEFSDDEEDENPDDVLYSGGIGLDIEEFSPHRHGGSYEVDQDEILSNIDEDRELEREYPAVHSFRRSSSNKRGMRKRAAASRTSAPKINTHLIREIISEKANDKFREANKSKSSYEMGLELRAVERLHSFLNSAGDKVYVTTNDNYSYSLWLEDPLDPLSKADPRNPTGMAVRLHVAELIEAIGQDHYNMIKGPAREAGYIEDEIMISGYGKWQFSGDTSELDMMGYTSDVLK